MWADRRSGPGDDEERRRTMPDVLEGRARRVGAEVAMVVSGGGFAFLSFFFSG